MSQLNFPQDDSDDDDDVIDRPYLFFINGSEIKTSISDCLKFLLVDTEKTVQIVYQPQAVFRFGLGTRFLLILTVLDGRTKYLIISPFNRTQPESLI